MIDKAQGCLLGVLIGDALGAPFEGSSPEYILTFSKSRDWKDGLIQEYVLAVQMATHIEREKNTFHNVVLEEECISSDGREIPYVEHGPIESNKDPRLACARFGMYTDDSNATLALASSLVECKKLDREHIAKRYGEFWQSGSEIRGYPPTAKAVMLKVLEGVDCTTTGLPPHFPFKKGSFANGGAMRIAPIALAFRNASPTKLKKAVAAAICSSHVHPEAVEGAFVQAMMIQYALNVPKISAFNCKNILELCLKHCSSDGMKLVLLLCMKEISEHKSKVADDVKVLSSIIRRISRPGSGMGFQIASVHAIPCVLWIVHRYAHSAPEAVKRAIALGGDTDTIASMVGAIVGALHGYGGWENEDDAHNWIKDLENSERGRDYALQLANELIGLNLQPTKMNHKWPVIFNCFN